MKNFFKINLTSVFLLLVGFYTLISISSYNIHSILGRLLYGLPFVIGGCVGVVWLFLVNKIYLTKITKIIIIILFFIFFIGILTIPISYLHFKVIYPIYIIGDASMILWLCFTIIGFGVIKNKNKINFKKIYNFYLFLTMLLLIYWIGLGIYKHSLDTPYFLIFSFILSDFIIQSIFLNKRFVLDLIISLFLLIIAFFGWSRSFFLGFIFCLFASFFMIFRLCNFKKWLTILCVLLLICIGFYFFSVDKLQQSRFYSTLSTGEILHGASVMERFNEANNAIKTMEEIPPSFLTGLGHGSVYFPYFEIGSIYRNLTVEGYVHNIHIGPILLFFRYGILGIILYIFFILVLIKGFFLGRKIYIRHSGFKKIGFEKIKDIYFPVKLFYTNYFIYSMLFIAFHFANHLIDPFFGLSLAIILMFITRPNLVLGDKAI